MIRLKNILFTNLVGSLFLKKNLFYKSSRDRICSFARLSYFGRTSPRTWIYSIYINFILLSFRNIIFLKENIISLKPVLEGLETVKLSDVFYEQTQMKHSLLCSTFVGSLYF